MISAQSLSLYVKKYHDSLMTTSHVQRHLKDMTIGMCVVETNPKEGDK